MFLALSLNTVTQWIIIQAEKMTIEKMWKKSIFEQLFMIVSALGVLFSIMTGCKSNNNVTITIQDPGDEIFPLDDYFKVEKTVNVSAESKGGLMSLIMDYYITDKYAFILDTNNRIFKVDLKTGDVVKQLFAGRHLSCMTGDDEYLYCLNIGENKNVCKYDFDLELHQEISIDRIRGTSSFIKTDEGFMFYNSKQNSKVGRFVVTDNDCANASSFLRAIEIPRTQQSGIPTTLLYPHSLFVPYRNGNMLFFDPEYNTAYVYNGKNLKKLFQFDDNDASLTDSRPPHISQLFFINGHILVKYSCNRKRCYAFLDNRYNVIRQGVVDPSMVKAQDLIIQQGRNRLVKISLTDVGPGDVVPDRSIQAQIIIYRAK